MNGKLVAIFGLFAVAVVVIARVPDGCRNQRFSGCINNCAPSTPASCAVCCQSRDKFPAGGECRKSAGVDTCYCFNCTAKATAKQG